MKFSETRSDQIGLAIIITLAILALFLLTSIFGWKGDDSGESRSVITVSGEGQAFAVPDTATFTYTLRGEGETAQSAQESVSTSAAAVLRSLETEGVNETDIKTQYYNVSPRYEYREVRDSVINPPQGSRVLVGYEAIQTNQVRVRSVDNAGALLGMVTSAGADDVSQLDFIVWDESEVEAEARQLAIEDAKQKADELAAQLGVRLGDITDFYEDQYGNPEPMYRSMEMMAVEDSQGGSVPAEISLGENEIRKNVSITFEIK